MRICVSSMDSPQENLHFIFYGREEIAPVDDKAIWVEALGLTRLSEIRDNTRPTTVLKSSQWIFSKLPVVILMSSLFRAVFPQGGRTGFVMHEQTLGDTARFYTSYGLYVYIYICFLFLFKVSSPFLAPCRTSGQTKAIQRHNDLGGRKDFRKNCKILTGFQVWGLLPK